MAIFGKLFGKKKDDLGLDTSLGGDFGMPELDTPTTPGSGIPQQQFPQQDFGESSVSPLRTYQPQSYPMQQPQQQFGQQPLSSRDVELILSKLDAIRSAITNIEIRIANLERIAGVEQKNDKGYRW